MLKTILMTVVVVLAAFLIFAATRPDNFRVERSVEIKAPPAKVYAMIDDFHGWSAWSPWEKLDLSMKKTYVGSAHGVGAIYTWEGNDKVGSGRMEIGEAVQDAKIVIKLDFLKPFEAHNVAQFVLTPSGDSTRVTWAMYGPSPYMAKVMGIFVSMDAMIGKDFESGLQNLKAAAEH